MLEKMLWDHRTDATFSSKMRFEARFISDSSCGTATVVVNHRLQVFHCLARSVAMSRVDFIVSGGLQSGVHDIIEPTGFKPVVVRFNHSRLLCFGSPAFFDLLLKIIHSPARAADVWNGNSAFEK